MVSPSVPFGPCTIDNGIAPICSVFHWNELLSPPSPPGVTPMRGHFLGTRMSQHDFLLPCFPPTRYFFSRNPKMPPCESKFKYTSPSFTPLPYIFSNGGPHPSPIRWFHPIVTPDSLSDPPQFKTFLTVIFQCMIF